MKKIQIIGNVCRDAEVKHFENSRSVINFDVAVNERWKGRDGQKQERTIFIRCAIWRDNTEISQFIKKGTKIYVEGSPETEAYINKQGEAVAVQKITVQNVEFLGGGQNNNQSGSQGGSQGQRQEAAPAGGGQDDAFLTPTPDEDLPF